MASCTSPRVSARTLPISRVMSWAYCSLRVSRISPAAIEDLGALGRGGETPGLPGFAGGGDGVVDVGGVGGLEFADDVIVVGGIDVLEGLAAVRGDPLAADEILVSCHADKDTRLRASAAAVCEAFGLFEICGFPTRKS